MYIPALLKGRRQPSSALPGASSSYVARYPPGRKLRLLAFAALARSIM
jgi:hypothetical protein